MKNHKDFLVLNYNTELKLPEQLYGTINRVGILNKEPILYGDANLLKPNDLYYVDSVKQVYRFVASETMYEQPLSQLDPGLLLANSNDKTVNKYRIFLFTSISHKLPSLFEEELTIPEEERGTIRNAGYLFNEIIYSGDPNLVENGQLFYHDNLPFINVVGINDGVITLATKTKLSGIDDATTIYTSYRVTPHSYSKDYLTFKALEDSTFTLTVPASVNSTYMTSISYSINNGITWTTTTINNTVQTITTPIINAGQKVLWKGVGKSMAISYNSNKYSRFYSTGNFNVSGNIMSLLYGDEFANQVALSSGSTYNFCCLFESNSKLISVENLILPATTLTNYCYSSMFKDCTSLTIAPILPAITLAQSCYQSMFSGCTSLKTAPSLPATTMAACCYECMFAGCTALTTAPELPATTLASGCYSNMFSGCTNLNYIKAMFTTTPSTAYTIGWVNGVASTGTFVKNSAATWDVTGNNGIPSGWTIVTVDS